MSRSVRGPDYRRPAIIMFQCFECATCTPNLPDVSGISLCDRHQSPELLFCDEVNSEFRQEPDGH